MGSMSPEELIQLFVILLWLTSTLYLASAWWAARPGRFEDVLSTRPLAAAAQRALRHIVASSIGISTVLTIVYLVISAYTLEPLFEAPTIVTIMGVIRFAAVYVLTVLPGTFLWGIVHGVRVIGDAKYQRMLDVQEASIAGISPEEVRRRRQRERT